MNTYELVETTVEELIVEFCEETLKSARDKKEADITAANFFTGILHNAEPISKSIIFVTVNVNEKQSNRSAAFIPRHRSHPLKRRCRLLVSRSKINIALTPPNAGGFRTQSVNPDPLPPAQNQTTACRFRSGSKISSSFVTL